MIPYCNAHGIGIIPWGPLMGGDLSKPLSEQSVRRSMRQKRYTEADKEIISRVEEVAKKREWTMTQVALTWLDSRVSSPIVGMNSPERLEGNIVRGKKLTGEEEKYLEEPYVLCFDCNAEFTVTKHLTPYVPIDTSRKWSVDMIE